MFNVKNSFENTILLKILSTIFYAKLAVNDTNRTSLSLITCEMYN